MRKKTFFFGSFYRISCDYCSQLSLTHPHTRVRKERFNFCQDEVYANVVVFLSTREFFLIHFRLYAWKTAEKHKTCSLPAAATFIRTARPSVYYARSQKCVWIREEADSRVFCVGVKSGSLHSKDIFLLLLCVALPWKWWLKWENRRGMESTCGVTCPDFLFGFFGF